jgi:hypothetical protein
MDALSQFTAVHKEIVNVEFENCSNLCQKFPNPPGNLCKISSEDFNWYDAIVGFRMVGALLSTIGCLSIIVSVLYYRKIKSWEMFPILSLAWSDLLFSIWLIIGSAYWYHPHEDQTPALLSLCITTSLFTSIAMLTSINLSVVYALTLCIKVKVRAGDTKHCTWNMYFVVLVTAHVLSWILPILLLVPLYGSKHTFWDCAHRCSCGCQPVFVNVLPYFSTDSFNNDPQNQYRTDFHQILKVLASIFTAQYSLDLILLLLLYGTMLYSMLCKSKGNLQMIADEVIYEEGGNRRVLYCKAVCRIMSYLILFFVCGFVNFVVSCLILYHETSGDTTVPKSHVRGMLLSQAVTLPLQGFLNAVVYGWTRQMFRAEILEQRPLLGPVQYQRDRMHSEEATLSFSSQIPQWQRRKRYTKT